MSDFTVLWIYLLVSTLLSMITFAIHFILKFKRQNPPPARAHLSYVFLRRNEEYKSNLVIEISLLILFLIFSWYSVSIGFTIFNKWLLNEFNGGFQFPFIITTIHMLMKLIISRVIFHNCMTNDLKAIIAKTQLTNNSTNNNATIVNNSDNTVSVSDGKPIAITPMKLFIIVVFIGICTSLDVVLSVESLLYINITLYTTLKATSIIFTFFWSIIFRIEIFRLRVLFSILGIFIGVGLAVFSMPKFSIFGIFLAISASAIGGLRWTLLQYLILADPSSASNAYVALYRFSPYACISILPLAIIFDGYHFVHSIFFEYFPLLMATFGIICLSGVLSFFLIITEVQLVQLTSSLALSVAGNIKEVVQIALSMMVYQDDVNIRSVAGIVLTLASAQYYSFLQSQFKQKDFPQYYFWYVSQYSRNNGILSFLNKFGLIKSRRPSMAKQIRRRHMMRRNSKLARSKQFVKTLDSIEEHPAEWSDKGDAFRGTFSTSKQNSQAHNRFNRNSINNGSNNSSRNNSVKSDDNNNNSGKNSDDGKSENNNINGHDKNLSLNDPHSTYTHSNNPTHNPMLRLEINTIDEFPSDDFKNNLDDNDDDIYDYDENDDFDDDNDYIDEEIDNEELENEFTSTSLGSDDDEEEEDEYDDEDVVRNMTDADVEKLQFIPSPNKNKIKNSNSSTASTSTNSSSSNSLTSNSNNNHNGVNKRVKKKTEQNLLRRNSIEQLLLSPGKTAMQLAGKSIAMMVGLKAADVKATPRASARETPRASARNNRLEIDSSINREERGVGDWYNNSPFSSTNSLINNNNINNNMRNSNVSDTIADINNDLTTPRL